MKPVALVRRGADATAPLYDGAAIVARDIERAVLAREFLRFETQMTHFYTFRKLSSYAYPWRSVETAYTRLNTNKSHTHTHTLHTNIPSRSIKKQEKKA